MEITILDRSQKYVEYKATYVATFSPASVQPLLACKFPENVDPCDAEKMLHMLHNMCSFPPVFEYIKSRIPSVFLPSRVKHRGLPVLPFLNYLAGPSNVFFLPWKQGDFFEYCKSFRGLSISYFTTDFIFPYDGCFVKEFIDAYGFGSWEDLGYQEVITDFSFRTAENDVAELLNKMESYFIKESCYKKLCDDLQAVCITIEKKFGEDIFHWSPNGDRLSLLPDYLHNLDIQRQ